MIKNAQIPKSSVLEDLMNTQIRTKPTIYKRWMNSSRKKCDYNCHTNFKLIKGGIQDGQTLNEQQMPNDLPRRQHEEACQTIMKSNNESNNSSSKENDEQIGKKHSLLPGKLITSYSSKDTLFGRIFRSLTSSSSNSNNASNPSANNSDNTSIQLNSTSNGCANLDALNANLEKTLNSNLQEDLDGSDERNRAKSTRSFGGLQEMKNSKSFNLENDISRNSISHNSFKKLNLSLNSLETSPKRLTVDSIDNCLPESSLNV